MTAGGAVLIAGAPGPARRALVDLLAGAGHATRACGLEEAAAGAVQAPPVFAIVEIGPWGEGWSLVRWLRARPRPVPVLVTGCVDPTIGPDLARRWGAEGVVSLPRDGEALCGRLAARLEGAETAGGGATGPRWVLASSDAGLRRTIVEAAARLGVTLRLLSGTSADEVARVLAGTTQDLFLLDEGLGAEGLSGLLGSADHVVVVAREGGAADGAVDALAAGVADFIPRPTEPIVAVADLVCAQARGVLFRAAKALADRREARAGRGRDLAGVVRARNEFLALAGQEIVNPLNVIRNWADTLIEEAGNYLTEDHRAGLKAIQRQAEVLASLTAHLTELARVEGGLAPVAVREVDVTALVLDAVEAHGLAARRRGIVVDASGDGGAVLLQLDPERLAEAFDVLLAGVLQEAREGDRIAVAVGVPPGGGAEILLFFQVAKGAGWRRIPEANLAIALVRRLIDLQRGRMEVTTSAAGIRYRILLPQRLPPEPAGGERLDPDGIRQMFVEGGDKRIGAFGQALERLAADPTDVDARVELARVGHSLHGVGGTYGFPEVSALGRAVEDLLQARSERKTALPPGPVPAEALAALGAVRGALVAVHRRAAGPAVSGAGETPEVRVAIERMRRVRG